MSNRQRSHRPCRRRLPLLFVSLRNKIMRCEMSVEGKNPENDPFENEVEPSFNLAQHDTSISPVVTLGSQGDSIVVFQYI